MDEYKVKLVYKDDDEIIIFSLTTGIPVLINRYSIEHHNELMAKEDDEEIEKKETSVFKDVVKKLYIKNNN